MTTPDIIAGHNQHQYIVDDNWGQLDVKLYPVTDCHEMMIDAANRLYMLTNNTNNNVLVYDLNGNLLNAWGTSYPGAHGLSISKEADIEYLYITDHDRHQVIKTTLTGAEVMVLNYPKETGCYTSANQYLPTETAVAPNGDIYVTDGYGLQYVIQYDKNGNYIRHWGGKGDAEAQFDCVHGIAIDNRNINRLQLVITSRNHNAFKYFTLDGQYLGATHLPGSFVCRPVIKGKYLYAAVFRSGHNMNLNSGYITILNEHNQVISTPGGTAPCYQSGILQPQQQAGPVFRHPHDVAVDDEGNIYVCQWKSGQTYPVKLKKVIH
ncbi:6-bladed beta-propeller [Mucilaginibacter sp. CSA2-8R]|uniref:6-bladed beta-propeller n=1 Tax=Mucilaginibacter sp. CSA2-8R TaxID=3141542 RepID=UPI00315CDDEE